MINVICLKTGKKYKSEYVNILKRMVDYHLSIDYRFFCFTDDSNGLDEDIEIIQADQKLIGWWGKLQYFSPYTNLSGPTLALDLDIILLNKIDQMIVPEIWNNPKTFYIMKDYFAANGNNSSVMLFDPSDCYDIYEDFFKANIHQISTGNKEGPTEGRNHYWGDQVWITEKRPMAKHWSSEKIKTWKWDHFAANKPVNYNQTCIMVFTGYPKPDSCPDKTLNLIWHQFKNR